VSSVLYSVLELAPNSTLCEFILSTGRFSERTARYFFRQMLQGLEYLHMQGWCHKDVKPENFLLDADFNIKLCDFGFSELRVGPRGDFKQMNFTGTKQYQAPEILRREPHDGEAADVFALGVSLFALVKAGHPFRLAVESDGWYDLLRKGRVDEFWKRHSNLQTHPIKFSLEFMDLFTQITAHDPKLRPSLAKLKQHVWCNLEVPSQQEVILEMRERVQQFREKKELERLQAMQNEQSVERNPSASQEMEQPKEVPTEKKAPKNKLASKPRSGRVETLDASLKPDRPDPPVFELADDYDNHDYHYSTLCYRDVVQLVVRWFSLKATSFEVNIDEFKVAARDQIVSSLDTWAGQTVRLELRIFRLVAGTVVEFFHVDGPRHSYCAFSKQIKSAIDLSI
jgi:serine/threonine protein kinase